MQHIYFLSGHPTNPAWEPKCNSKVYNVSLLKFFKINRENGSIYLFIHLVTETKSHADT